MPRERKLKQWTTGERGGRYYTDDQGNKHYGKEAEEMARSEGLKSMAASVDKPQAPMSRLGELRKSDALKKMKTVPFEKPEIKDQPKDAHPEALPAKRNWIPPGEKADMNDGHDESVCPKPKDGGTLAKFMTGGQFNEKGEMIARGTVSPERQALHREIIQRALDKAPPADPNKRPIAVLTMGGTASGKTTMLQSAGIPQDAFVQVNADDIKEELPEYQTLADGDRSRGRSYKSAAAAVHEESSMVAKALRAAAMEQRRDLIFDGTGRNADSYTKLIKELKAKGYEVHVMMTDLDADEGVKRANVRAERTGRWVNEEFVRDCYQSIPPNFERVARAADGFELYDKHGGPGEDRVVWSKSEGKETVFDQEYKDRFDRGEPRGHIRAKAKAKQAEGRTAA